MVAKVAEVNIENAKVSSQVHRVAYVHTVYCASRIVTTEHTQNFYNMNDVRL